ncbi:hypothetical protein Tco_0605435 [Tanacetum coccineum]
MESSFSNTADRELQQLQERMTKTRKNCSIYFELINKHSKYLLNIRWFACTRIEDGFKLPIQRYFGDNHDTLIKKLSYNIDNLQRQLKNEYLQECESMTCFKVLRAQFETFFTSKHVESSERDDQVLKQRFQEYTSKELQYFRRELLYYMESLEMNIGRRALHESESLNAGVDSEASIDDNTSIGPHDGSSSSGFVADAERAWIDKVVSHKENDVVRPSLDNNTLTETAQTFHMLLPKEDNFNTGKQGLGFKNQNDVDNPFLLNKAMELTPSLYNTDEMGKDLLFDHKIILEEELKCEAEKCLKVKQRKTPLSYHGFVYDET